MLEPENVRRSVPAFKDSIKKRILMLSQFEFAKLKNFNLQKNLRFQFVLENLLQYEVEEADMRSTVQHLMDSHQTLLLNILSSKKNLQLIMRGILEGNYVYFEFLVEAFEVVRMKPKIYESVQENMLASGLTDCVLYLLSKFRFHSIDGILLLSVQDYYFKDATRIIAFLQIICAYVQLNPHAFVLKTSVSSAGDEPRRIFAFFLSLLFQVSLPRVHKAAAQVLTNLLRNIGHANSSCFRTAFVEAFAGIAAEHGVARCEQFFDMYELFVDLQERDFFVDFLGNTRLLADAVARLNFRRAKLRSLQVIKILNYAGSISADFVSGEITHILAQKVSHLKHRDRNSLLVGNLRAFCKNMLELSPDACAGLAQIEQTLLNLSN